MIKIVGFQKAGEGADGSNRTASVTADNDKIQISFNGRAIEIDPAIVTTKPDIAAVYEGVEQTMVLGWDSERFNTRDMASSIADRKGVADIVNYVCLVGFDVNDTYVVFRKPVTTADGVTLVSADDTAIYRPREWMSQQSATLAALVTQNKAKRTMLAHTSTNDRVAMLEQQLDLLTQLVAKLIAGSAMPSWAQDFITTMQADVAVAAGSEAAATDAISAEKSKNRDLQADYRSAISPRKTGGPA